MSAGTFALTDARVEMSAYDPSVDGSARAAKLRCPECGSPMELRRNRHKVTHTHPTGAPFYGCTRYPDCKNTHGAHPDGSPLGRPGNAEEREARKQVHEWFDRLWLGGRMQRSEAYAWLKTVSNVPAHISEMNVDECQRVIVEVKKKLMAMLSTKWRGNTQGKGR